jgi:CDGSH-type Zn-finger protein/uncharacterized Fe-S cluster protein YjdI
MAKPIEEVSSAQVTVRFDAVKCIHSRGCVLARPDVFVPNVEGEWIHPEAATAEEVAELAHNCPSGAITYVRLDGGPQEAAPVVNLVRVRENGPLAFQAELAELSELSELAVPADAAPTFRATLCRCGQSKRKPYCDMSHGPAGFTATGEAPTRASEPLAKRNGRLAVTPSENGPLLVNGNLEVVSGTGRTILRCTKTALCRCGGSSNKPFCDGTHKTNGFRADGAK